MVKLNVFIQFDGNNYAELWDILSQFFWEKNLTFYIDDSFNNLVKEPKKADLKRKTDRDKFLSDYDKHFKCWIDSSKQKGNYYEWNADQNNDISDTNILYCEIAERIHSYSNDNQKFVLFEFAAGQKSAHYIIKDIFSQRNEKIPALLRFETIKTELDLHLWITNNRQTRTFDYCDKHHRTDKYARWDSKLAEWVSPYLYLASEDKEVEKTLLKQAVQVDSSTLVAWDAVKNCYLVFKNNSKKETGTNAFDYHGFHITGAKDKKPNEEGGQEAMLNEILNPKQRGFIDKKFKK